jgi:hypothetical protein
MGSCKRRQGINGVRIGIGESIVNPKKRHHRTGNSFSFESLMAMPAGIKNRLVKFFLGPSRVRRETSQQQKRGG